MHDPISSLEPQQSPALRLGGSHGYRIDGDLAAINAELSLAEALGAPAAQHWALQLWACDEPYGGGTLRGFKVAEAPIAVSTETVRSQLDALAFAHPPTAPRDYSMVLVLAGGQPGAFDQVHDFANYPARERFLVPQLEGQVDYQLLPEGKVALRAERVGNPRAENNLSGSLALQLWVMAAPYRGGSFTGTMVASAALGRVHGQSWIEPGEQVVALGSAPAEGHAVLMLREWTAEGYLTRDYRNLPEQPRAVAAQPADVVCEGAVRPSLHGASAEELVRATGISKKLAADVIKARPFKSFNELTRVRGIGEKMVRKFRDALTL